MTNSFGNRNFMQPMGGLNMRPKCLDFFSFKFCVAGGCFSFVLNMFPMCSPMVFPIAPHFNPLCLAHSPPLLTFIGGPKGEVLNLSIESSILGSLHSFIFFLQWAKSMAHYEKKKLDLRHSELINMKQNR